MYSSLDKIDIVATIDDKQVGIQTDHRSRDEIASEFDLSVIFAAARVCNARFFAEDINAVRVTFSSVGHEDLTQFIQSLGAEVESQDRTFPAAEDEVNSLGVLRTSLKRLGNEVIARHKVSSDQQGLTALQNAIREQAKQCGGPEDDEITYWTCVAELGAATAIILQQQVEANWQITKERYAMIPLILATDGAAEDSLKVNVFGKVEKYFDQGDSEAPTQLFTLLSHTGVSPDEGRVMFSLRQDTWGGAKIAATRPLLPPKDGHSGIPLVALIRDMPETIATISSESTEDELTSLRKEALANLANVQVEIAEGDFGGDTMLIVTNDYFASEKILDVEFVKGLAQRLNTEALMVAVPVRGVAFVASAATDPQLALALGMMARNQFNEAPERERISHLLFMFHEGVPVAYLEPPDPSELEQ